MNKKVNTEGLKKILKKIIKEEMDHMGMMDEDMNPPISMIDYEEKKFDKYKPEEDIELPKKRKMSPYKSMVSKFVRFLKKKGATKDEIAEAINEACEEDEY